jgi:hypothetical protein
MGHHGKKKFSRRFSHAGKKSFRAVKHAAHKIDLEKTGHLMQDVGSAGEMLSAGLTMAGLPEVGVPLLGASEGLKYGGKALEGAGKAKKQVHDGNYVGAAMTIEKTVASAKKDKSKNKKYR